MTGASLRLGPGNHVLNRQKNKSAEPITTVPKKDIFLGLPFLGSQSDILARRVNLVLVNFMVMSILGLFLIILAELSFSFHTKTVLAALKDRNKINKYTFI